MLTRILLAGLLTATLICAQGKKGGGGRGGPNMPQGSFTAAPLDRIADTLKLSKDQKRDLKATFDEAQKDATPIHEQLTKSRLAIGEAVAAGKTPDEIAKACAEEAQFESQMTEIELKAFTKVWAGLEDDQKKQASGLLLMMRGMFSRKNWNEAE